MVLRDLNDMIDRSDAADRIDHMLAADPMDPRDANDPIEPIDKMLPTDPIDSIEFLLPILRIEPSDFQHHNDFCAGEAPSADLMSSFIAQA